MTDGRLRGPSVRTFTRRAGRVALTVMAILLIALFVLVGVLLFMSPGTPKPFLDVSGKPLVGSISEKIKVNINGVEQGMFIKGKNEQRDEQDSHDSQSDTPRPPCERSDRRPTQSAICHPAAFDCPPNE